MCSSDLNTWNADGTAYVFRSPYGTAKTAASTAGWEYGYRFLARASKANATSTAVYGQGTYTPESMQHLHFTVGGRYTTDKRDGELFRVVGKVTNFTFHYDKGRFDPMVNLAYDVSDNGSIYAKYSTGYRAGGANDRSQTFTAFNPEAVKRSEEHTSELQSRLHLVCRLLLE